jgi:intracellular sulfur oxidation DsrE/DsrF family protein
MRQRGTVRRDRRARQYVANGNRGHAPPCRRLPLAACAASACSGEAGPTIGLVETAKEFDPAAFDRAVATSARYRQVWDADGLRPQMLGNVKNALNGLQFGFSVAPGDIALAFVAHGTANLLLYDDAMWSAYRLGELFGVKDPSGAIVAKNIFAPSRSQPSAQDPDDVHGFYQDPSIATLQRRGARFFACNTALVEQADAIANAGATGRATAQEIARDLRSHLLAGAMLVPSGTAAILYLQARHGYAYAY